MVSANRCTSMKLFILQGSYGSWKTRKVLEFSRTGGPGKRPLVLESSGNLLNSAKNYM